MNEAAGQNWSTRALERQIGTLYYERLLASADRESVEAEAVQNLAALPVTPREFVRDPVMLEFLGLPDTGRFPFESSLEQALMDKLQHFLLELGKGFAFVARQQRISTETQDFYVDLVFYNYLLKCFVLIDLKIGQLAHQDIGQMDMYVRMYDDLRRNEGDNPTVGILLCGGKDQSVVRYSVLHESEQLFASKYRLVLPSEIGVAAGNRARAGASGHQGRTRSGLTRGTLSMSKSKTQRPVRKNRGLHRPFFSLPAPGPWSRMKAVAVSEAVYADESIWLTQKMMGVLYDVDVRTVNYHLKKVFSDSELEVEAVIRNFRITASDGKNYYTQHWAGLSATAAVGYKVNSERAVQFRKWATSIIEQVHHQGLCDGRRTHQGWRLYPPSSISKSSCSASGRFVSRSASSIRRSPTYTPRRLIMT